MEKKDYFLIVTANENETNALLNDQCFTYNDNQRSDIPHDVTFYNIGQYGYYNVVHFELNTQGAVGSDASQLSIATAIDAFQPKAVILVGIAFGKDFSDDKNRKQSIGDVLISKTVADYESGKVKNSKIESDGVIAESGRELFSVFKNYSRTWKYIINGNVAMCECGLILSGDNVVDDKNFKKCLMNRFPRAIGGEMEGRGAYGACRSRNLSEWIIIKSICDWADGSKEENKKENQIIASRSAVSLLNYVFTQKDSLKKIAAPEKYFYVKNNSLSNLSNSNNLIFELETMQNSFLDGIYSHIKNNENKFEEAKKMIENFITYVGKPIFFGDVISMILSCDEKIVLRINGMRGTGKSTFFTLVYHELKNRQKDTGVFPILIDLRILNKNYRNSAKVVLKNFLDKISKLISECPGKKYFIMIDGMNEHEIGDSKLEELINDYIFDEENNTQNYAFCIGNTEGMPEEQSHISALYSTSSQSKYQIDVSKIAGVAYSNLDKILMQLINIYDFDIDVSSISSIKKVIDDYTVNHIDYRTLLILLRVFWRNNNQIKESHLGSSFFNYYLHQFKGKESELYKCAEIAYNNVIRHIKTRSAKYLDIFYNNGITTDFFLALHFINIMRTPPKNAKDVLGGDFVFTALTNKFIRELLNVKYKAEQSNILNNMISLYNSLDNSMQSQICYILGRIQSGNAKKNAQCFLAKQWDTIYHDLFYKNILKCHDEVMNRLILFRTISVSLVVLGDDTKLEDFLQCILYNEKLNQINRGFHIEYYEDKSYLNGVSPSYLDDKSVPANRTMNYLMDSINKKLLLKTTINKSIYLDIITLFSIYQYRIDDADFLKTYRDELKKIIDKVSVSSKIQSNTITNYIQTINENFDAPNPIKHILTEINAVKLQKRQGWIDREVKLPESIADHRYGCYIIGMFLLPNNINQCSDYKIPDIEEYSDYSKEHILKMVLLHDLAEAKEGDVVTNKKESSDVEKENMRFNYYQYLCSFPRIYGLGTKKELWNEFSANSTINAKIANDIDKIEAVIQAYFYCDENNRIDMNEWISYAKKRISTSLIKQLLQYL